MEDKSKGYPLRTSDGKYTLRGLYEKCMVESHIFEKKKERKDNDWKPHLSKKWEVGTTVEYASNYCNRLIPFLGEILGKEKAVEDFDSDEVENAFEAFKEKMGYDGDGDTFRRYRHLFWTLYKTGADNVPFVDQLEWDWLGRDENKRDSDALKLDMMKTLKRSFTIEDERLIADKFKYELGSGFCDGVYYGVFLMYVFGLRNAEAAAVTFSCIKSLPEKGIWYLDIYRTTTDDTNTIKVGGKTVNFFRRLPVQPFVKKYIDKRFEVVVSDLMSREGLLRENAERIAREYTIACRGRRFSEGADRNDLNEAWKELVLKKLKVLSTQNALTLKNTFKQKLESYNVEEEDPTVYVLRRNNATHLYNLGLSLSQIQYCMGHLIEDSQDQRSYYLNDDLLEELNDVMKNHPLRLLFGDKVTYEKSVTILHGKSNKAYIRIAAKEPNDSIELEVEKHKGSVKVRQSDVFLQSGYSPTVDIRAEVCRKYGDNWEEGISEPPIPEFPILRLSDKKDFTVSRPLIP